MLSDSLQQINMGEMLKIETKSDQFRTAHMKTKEFLFNKKSESELEQLSRG
jgi:hypothetical protein